MLKVLSLSGMIRTLTLMRGEAVALFSLAEASYVTVLCSQLHRVHDRNAGSISSRVPLSMHHLPLWPTSHVHIITATTPTAIKPIPVHIHPQPPAPALFSFSPRLDAIAEGSPSRVSVGVAELVGPLIELVVVVLSTVATEVTVLCWLVGAAVDSLVCPVPWAPVAVWPTLLGGEAEMTVSHGVLNTTPHASVPFSVEAEMLEAMLDAADEKVPGP